MSVKATFLKHQREWATAASLQPDAHGYLASYELNLHRPLSPAARAAFTQGSGAELVATSRRPAKMAALHSSSALAVNAFDYWSDRPLEHVAAALAIERSPTHFRFEAKFPTGLGGTPPNLDLAFTYADGRTLGVESKFSEWLTPKALGNKIFKAKYFDDGKSLWSAVGLPHAQRLADALQDGAQVFRYLDAAQLLKHMLGLATTAPGRSSLCYVYYDGSGSEASIHRAELDRFAELICTDMPFHRISYQRFFGHLQATLCEEHAPYVDYMHRRYCVGVA